MLPILLLLLAVTLFLTKPVINNIFGNIYLSSFENQLVKKPLPEKTSIVDTKPKYDDEESIPCDGTDFFACILVKSDLSQKELKSYYANINFKTAKPGTEAASHTVAFDVLQLQGKTFTTDYESVGGELTFDALKNVKDYSKYFIVMIYDGDYSPSFEFLD